MSTTDPTGSRWLRSSYSAGGNDANCVEVAAGCQSIAVRDSKNPAAGSLELATPAWHDLLNTLR